MKLQLEATINDVKLHNSKLDDENWVDVIVRALGSSNIEAAMLMHRAKNKIVKMEFEIDDN